MKKNLRLLLIQADILWKKIPENLDRYKEKISRTQGADLIIMPEMFASGFIHDPETVVSWQSEVEQWLIHTSTQFNTALIASHPVREGTEYFNRLFCVQPEGVIMTYDKRHLFAYGGEKKSYSPGTYRSQVETKGWKILPLICYDLRFPVWSRNTEDYQLLVYIANWPSERMHIWKTLLRARAIENQCYVAGINRTGTDGNGIRYTGQSMLVSPDGTILKSLGEEEGMIEWEADPEFLQKYRKKFPFLEDRDEFEIKK